VWCLDRPWPAEFERRPACAPAPESLIAFEDEHLLVINKPAG
jgi:23S rRNA-/tRNA-specific pseudouridylate synthase